MIDGIVSPIASKIVRSVPSPISQQQYTKQVPGPYLIYLARPNSDYYLIGEDTDIGEDTYIWAYDVGSDSTIRAATGWTTGNGWETAGNPLYYDDGTPRSAWATELAAWSSINTGGVLFKIKSATQQTGKLVIYNPAETVLIAKAKTILGIS